MNKTDLIDAIASSAKLNKKQAKAALEATLDAITGSLKKGEAVQLIGFGTNIYRILNIFPSLVKI